MNRGLVIRAVRESWPVTLLIGVVLLGVESALGFILPKFGLQMSQGWLRLGFMRGMMQAMLGTEVTDRIGPDMFQAIAWVHPVVLALIWAHAITLCTRVPVGELERGTIDVLLGLPVSRWELFLSETIVWVVSAGFILLLALAGNLLGGMGLPVDYRPDRVRVLAVLLNLFCLYLAVGGFAWLVSALSSRRGRAITVVFLVLLVSFLLNYLAPFWKVLEHVTFLNPLQYHQPVRVLTGQSWPWRDMLVLLTSGILLWIAAGAVFARRDLCSV